jgi:hypothetical protein
MTMFPAHHAKHRRRPAELPEPVAAEVNGTDE